MRDAVNRERFEGGAVDLWEGHGSMSRQFVLRGGDEPVARAMRRFCGVVEGSWDAAFWRKVESDVAKAHPDRARAPRAPCDVYRASSP